MARGGYRPGAGRPPKEAGKAPVIKNESDAEKPRKSLGGLSPLEYMLSVMNDPEQDGQRRDKMAIAAAPYVHGKAADTAPGKKEQRKENAHNASAGGKFGVPTAPKLIVNNGE